MWSTNQITHATRRSLGNCSKISLLGLRKQSWWYNCQLNEGKETFKEIHRWFYGNPLKDGKENDIIARIGYFMRKNYNEESKIEGVLEYLDGVLDIIQSIVVQEIRNDFMSRNMDSVFIESNMTHKALQSLKLIDYHGVLKGVNPISASKKMKRWRKKLKILIWVGRELMASHMELEWTR